MRKILYNIGVFQIEKEIELILHGLNALLPRFTITFGRQANVFACSNLSWIRPGISPMEQFLSSRYNLITLTYSWAIAAADFVDHSISTATNFFMISPEIVL